MKTRMSAQFNVLQNLVGFFLFQYYIPFCFCHSFRLKIWGRDTILSNFTSAYFAVDKSGELEVDSVFRLGQIHLFKKRIVLQNFTEFEK